MRLSLYSHSPRRSPERQLHLRIPCLRGAVWGRISHRPLRALGGRNPSPMIAQVILPLRTPLALPWFDYVVPVSLEPEIKIGQLVEVPFRNHNEFGIVRSVGKNSETKQKLKPLSAIFSNHPLLSANQLLFLEELSALYHTSLGFLLKTNLLPLQKRKLKALAKEITESIPPPPPLKTFQKPLLFTYSNNETRGKYIFEHLSTDGQNLILVPEISEIETIKQLVSKKILDDVVVVTGDTTPKELFEIWKQIWLEEKHTVLGTRRALFLPWHNLQTIILDDEGNTNYKSWDMAPRFHTRDAAVYLAKHHGANLHLLSHTPSVETYYFAKREVYQSVTKEITFPPTHHYSIVDVAGERRGGNYGILSEEVVEAIKKNKTRDIFLFLNRRGSLNYVACRDCKTVFECPKCHRPLAYFDDKKKLLCHYCNYTEPMRATCPRCNGFTLAMYGAGTQQVEREIKMMLGASDLHSIERLDSDSPHHKPSTYGLEPTASPHLIIGTQLAWDKINWKTLGLMVFVDADISLFVPEYKITENLWQQMRDARYRLSENAELFVQTRHPDHFVFQALGNPPSFY